MFLGMDIHSGIVLATRKFTIVSFSGKSFFPGIEFGNDWQIVLMKRNWDGWVCFLFIECKNCFCLRRSDSGKRTVHSIFFPSEMSPLWRLTANWTDQASQRGPDDHPVQKNPTAGRAAKGRSTDGSATYAQPSSKSKTHVCVAIKRNFFPGRLM